LKKLDEWATQTGQLHRCRLNLERPSYSQNGCDDTNSQRQQYRVKKSQFKADGDKQ